MKATLPVFFSLLACASQAAPTVSCEADYGGKISRIDVTPSDDAFAFQTVDVDTRFRFSVQFLERRSKLKTFVHELEDRTPVLLHAAEYPLPADACASGAIDFGLNKVYSSYLGRELFFHCSAKCE